MDREVWIRAGMFGTIILLVGLILLTPNLLGHTSEITSLPILIFAATSDQKSLIVDVTGAQAYLYSNISLNVTHRNAANVTTYWKNVSMNESYGAEVYVPMNLSSWHVHVRLMDRQRNYFEYNVSARAFNDTNNRDRLTLAFTLPDDRSTTIYYAVPPDDYRVAVPRRGVLP